MNNEIIIGDYIGKKKLFKEIWDKLYPISISYEVHPEEFYEYVSNLTKKLAKDMNVYIHSDEKDIPGCLMNIEYDWRYDHKKSNSFNEFSSILLIIDQCFSNVAEENRKQQQAFLNNHKRDIIAFQNYVRDWFWKAFGSFGIEYNFMNFIQEKRNEI